jgi:hypothetical protein
VTTRIGAREKFRWRGWEFKLSRADSKEAHWSMREGKFEIRVIYRAGWLSHFDPPKDPAEAPKPPLEVPAEWTAIIKTHGISSEAGVGGSPDQALASAEVNFRAKVVAAARVYSELRRGKQPDPDS